MPARRIGPLLAAFIVVPFGQPSIAWFSVVALLAMVVLYRVGLWYRARILLLRSRPRSARARRPFTRAAILVSIAILMLLTFSKNFYTRQHHQLFYLLPDRPVPALGSGCPVLPVRLLVAVAAGTLLGGPVGDRFGRKYVIWFSILGVLPFTLALPYANLFWTGVLSVIIGLILASAFSAILVYARTRAGTGRR